MPCGKLVLYVRCTVQMHEDYGGDKHLSRITISSLCTFRWAQQSLSKSYVIHQCHHPPHHPYLSLLVSDHYLCPPLSLADRSQVVTRIPNITPQCERPTGQWEAVDVRAASLTPLKACRRQSRPSGLKWVIYLWRKWPYPERQHGSWGECRGEALQGTGEEAEGGCGQGCQDCQAASAG